MRRLDSFRRSRRKALFSVVMETQTHPSEVIKQKPLYFKLEIVMKLLQAFAISVAASAIGAQKQDVSDGIDDYEAGNPPKMIVGYSAIAWMALLEALLAAFSGLIDNCPQNNVGVRESVKKPSRRQKVAAIREIRRNVDDCDGFRWRKQSERVIQSAFAQAATLTDDELDKIIAEARSNAF